jgi:hypothetical protein
MRQQLLTNLPPWKISPPAQKRAPTLLAQKSAALVRPSPGVYESKPYTSIVIVPAPHPDDRICVVADSSRFNLRIIQPEVQLVPRR